LYIEWWINRLVSCSKALADEWPPLRSWGWGFLGQADKAPKTTLGWKWTHLYQPKRTTPQHHNDRWFCLIAAFAWLLYHIDVTTTTKTQISSLFRVPSLQTASTSIYIQPNQAPAAALLLPHWNDCHLKMGNEIVILSSLNCHVIASQSQVASNIKNVHKIVPKSTQVRNSSRDVSSCSRDL
jgi:hypothetical protein